MMDRDSTTRTGARTPGVGGVIHLMAACHRAHRPDSERCHRCGYEMREGQTQTGRRTAYAGSRLKLGDVPGRLCLISRPSSRTGENPPYGMIGGIEETSASFEARSAPRSYPTIGVVL